MTDRVVTYHPQMLDDLEWWRDNDLETGQRVVAAIEEAQAHPENGVGRPKRMGGLLGVWSRRITRHHRLFYALTDCDLHFISCRGHDLRDVHREALRVGGLA